jgi:hypothetical protein
MKRRNAAKEQLCAFALLPQLPWVGQVLPHLPTRFLYSALIAKTTSIIRHTFPAPPP